jgi:hypothetical protein
LKDKINSILVRLPVIALFIFLIGGASNLHGATQTDSLFRSDEIIKMELRSDFTAIEADRTGQAVYHDGELLYQTSGGEPVKLPVKLIVRGHYRRDTANCNFPPLYVNFKKGGVKNTIFSDQDELKLVTPCQDENDVIDEYLIYKLYNRITDLSLKVRLVKILYYDTGSKSKLFEKYSFFIEDKDHAAARNNSLKKDLILTPYDIDRENFKKLSVFQYMIGNGDWSFAYNHNIVPVVPENSAEKVRLIPYDFDLSSFVNAAYGVDQRPGRIYKGLCYSQAEFDEVFSFYRSLRPEFESIINNMNHLQNSTKKFMLKYLAYFYKVIDDEKLVRREFINECEKAIDYRLKLRQP